MRPINLWFGALLLLAPACGGDVEDSGPAGDGGPSATDGSSTAPGAAAASSTTSSGDPTTKTQLGDCTSGTPGTLASPVSECPWYAQVNGITCYPSREQACNCSCPANIASNCVSDWPDDSKPQLVYCK